MKMTRIRLCLRIYKKLGMIIHFGESFLIHVYVGYQLGLVLLTTSSKVANVYYKEREEGCFGVPGTSQ